MSRNHTTMLGNRHEGHGRRGRLWLLAVCVAVIALAACGRKVGPTTASAEPGAGTGTQVVDPTPAPTRAATEAAPPPAPTRVAPSPTPTPAPSPTPPPTPAGPPSAAVSAADLKVIEQREVETEPGWVLALSPDGRRLAELVQESLCVYDTDRMAVLSCADVQSGYVGGVAWSPDSTRIAYTEEFARYFYEPDIWVLEVETGRTTNLTDDGVDPRQSVLKEGDLAVDLGPAWSPDGKTLVFARTPRRAGEWGGTTLHAIPAGGGEPRKLLDIADDLQFTVLYGLYWPRDDDHIFYTFSVPDLDHPDSGVWRVRSDGRKPEHLLRQGDGDGGLVLLVDVSADGGEVLAQHVDPDDPGDPEYVLLHTSMGWVDPVRPADVGGTESRPIRNAVFSPDGSKILYIYAGVDGASVLAVRDVQGGTESILLTHGPSLGVSREFGRFPLGLDWVEDDTVYAAISSRSGLLLQLGADDQEAATE